MDESITNNQIIFTENGLKEFIAYIKKDIPTINYNNHMITVGNLFENEQQQTPIPLINNINGGTATPTTNPRIILNINGTDTTFLLNGYSNTWEEAESNQLVTKNAISNRLKTLINPYATQIEINADSWIAPSDDLVYYSQTITLDDKHTLLTANDSPIISIDLSKASMKEDIEIQQEQWSKIYKCIVKGDDETTNDQLEFRAFEKPDATFYVKIRL